MWHRGGDTMGQVPQLATVKGGSDGWLQTHAGAVEEHGELARGAIAVFGEVELQHVGRLFVAM